MLRCPKIAIAVLLAGSIAAVSHAQDVSREALYEIDPQSDDAKFLQVRLRRDENRITEDINTAIRIANDLLAIWE